MTLQELMTRWNGYQIEMRRWFHQHPEESTKEVRTAERIRAELDRAGIPWRPCGLGTGTLARIEGAQPGRTILLRGDIDALSVNEETGLPYASEVPGVMHACGHDCHISMLLTAAMIVNEIRDRLKGTIVFAFQPAEELGLGARAMIEEGALEGVDACFGMHVWSDYPAGTELDVILLSSKAEDGLYRFSKKKVDKIKEGDKIVDTIRGGEVFELVVDRETKGGLLGKLGTYTVFVPASQIKEKYVHDLKPFVGKTLRLTQLEIDDAKRRIVASQKVVLEKERKEREEIFWANVVPGVIVNGKVKGISKFGAFVSVDGYDCLVHISDIAWTKFKSIDDILHVGKKYDFVVLKADREKGKVSLGYKQLQKHPFDAAIENHPVGSVVKGKVTSLMPFGAFVEIEPGVEGLVHVSEASNTYVKNINDVYKVGDEVEVKILAIDPEEKKITLSAKACMPEPTEEEKAARSERRESKPRAPRKREQQREEGAEWSEDAGNNPFADLLKDLDMKK